jgi:hypothetical protein
MAGLTIDEVVERFLRDLEVGRAPATVATYRSVLRRFAEFLDGSTPRPAALDELTAPTVLGVPVSDTLMGVLIGAILTAVFSLVNARLNARWQREAKVAELEQTHANQMELAQQQQEAQRQLALDQQASQERLAAEAQTHQLRLEREAHRAQERLAIGNDARDRRKEAIRPMRDFVIKYVDLHVPLIGHEGTLPDSVKAAEARGEIQGMIRGGGLAGAMVPVTKDSPLYQAFRAFAAAAVGVTDSVLEFGVVILADDPRWERLLVEAEGLHRALDAYVDGETALSDRTPDPPDPPVPPTD